MALCKIFIVLVLQYIQLNSVMNAPCVNSQTNNSTECIENKQDDTLPRIVTRPTRTKQASLLASLLGEDIDVLFGDEQIVFPDTDTYELLFRPIKAPSKCTNDLSLCEEVQTYPYNRIRATVGKEHHEFFGVDEAPTEFANRVGEPTENFICGSIETTIFPKAGRNKNNKWKYIINQGENEGYRQGIRIEKCTQFDGPCNLISGAPVGYVASCKQKFVLRRLLSITDNGDPVPDSFQIPSACCCAFRKDVNFLFGRSGSTPAFKPRR